MSDNFIERIFENLKGTDADYLLICRNEQNWSYNGIPNIFFDLDTIDEVIAWHFERGWKIVEIYDLYAPFEKSMIRSATISNHYRVAMAGDVVDIRQLALDISKL